MFEASQLKWALPLVLFVSPTFAAADVLLGLFITAPLLLVIGLVERLFWKIDLFLTTRRVRRLGVIQRSFNKAGSDIITDPGRQQVQGIGLIVSTSVLFRQGLDER